MLEEFFKVLLHNGPMGIMAAGFFWLLLKERDSHEKTRDTLNGLTSRYEELVVKSTEAMTHVSLLVSERLPRKD